MTDIKAFAKAMRENPCKDSNGNVICSPELWEMVASIIENSGETIYRQKAEIKRLKWEAAILSENADSAFQDGLNEAQDLYASQIRGEVRAEAIKDFAERLKKEACYFSRAVAIEDIDNLVKEMTGGEAE